MKKAKNPGLFPLLILIVVFTCIFASGTGTDSLPIAPDTETTANIDLAGKTEYFHYTPTVSGVYTIRSLNSRRACECYLYDSDMNALSPALAGSGSNSNNFSLSYPLQSGETYYFGVKLSDKNRTGTVDIILELTESTGGCTEHDFSRKEPESAYLKSEADCKSSAVYYYVCQGCDEKSADKTYSYGKPKGHAYPTEWNNILPPDCTQRGLRIKVCPVCIDVISEILTPTGHKDKNSDNICDTCSENCKEENAAQTSIEATTEITTEKPTEPTTRLTDPSTGETTTKPPETTTEPVTEPVTEPSVENVTESKKADDCDCMCHSNSFLWKIVRFFIMIFGVNEECSCGEEHY